MINLIMFLKMKISFMHSLDVYAILIHYVTMWWNRTVPNSRQHLTSHVTGGVVCFWGGIWLLGALFMLVLLAKNYVVNNHYTDHYSDWYWNLMFFDLNNRTRLILIMSKPIKIVVVVVVIVVSVFVKNKHKICA